MQPCDDDDIEDDDLAAKLKQKGMTLAYRKEARAFKRLFNTADGKMVLESIKRDINWDGSGPRKHDESKVISLEEWVGQRTVMQAIETKISHGANFTREETENKPTN